MLQVTLKNTRQLLQKNKEAATVITKDTILMDDGGGYLVTADNTATVATLAGVANETIAAVDALTQVLVIEIDPMDTWIMNTANNSDATHNYQKMILSDAVTANNTGTTSAVGVVEQIMPIGAAADKKILVRFVA